MTSFTTVVWLFVWLRLPLSFSLSFRFFFRSLLLPFPPSPLDEPLLLLPLRPDCDDLFPELDLLLLVCSLACLAFGLRVFTATVSHSSASSLALLSSSFALFSPSLLEAIVESDGLVSGFSSSEADLLGSFSAGLAVTADRLELSTFFSSVSKELDILLEGSST